ncbi:MAG: icmW [Gammaproteobacteria bacterium]|jgi:intracellular multiplication protein IcmW|nr:icmW [Gammaproteobacteria bacterium]
MPDLSHDGVHQFWKEYPDEMIYRVVSFMEGVEHWTVDEDPEFETAMQSLADSLETIGNYELGHQQELVTLCTYIKMARMLRLLQTIDTAHPGGASKVLMYAEENSTSNDDIPGIFLRRNIVFERLRLLGRVFANERIAIVMKALGSDK